MRHLNKFTNISIILITGILLITCIFTYQGFQNYQQTIKNDWPMKHIADDINDDLSINPAQINTVVSANVSRFPATYLAFDEAFEPFLAPSEEWIFIATKDEAISDPVIGRIAYKDLKKICQKLVDQLEKDTASPIMLTFNYAAVTTDYISVPNIIYLEVNGETVYNVNKADPSTLSTITCQLNEFYTPLLDIQKQTDENGYYYNNNIPKYEYLEEFFTKNYQNNEISDTGYYKLTTPKDTPYQPEILQKNEKPIYYSFCIQKLSKSYSHYRDYQNNSGESNYLDDRIGYLVWAQFDNIYQPYHLTNYLFDHYYLYLLIIAFTSLLLFFIKKGLKTTPQLITAPSKVPAKSKHYDVVDIEPVITNLINNSTNALKFKHINIVYQPQKTILNGNHDEITKIITELYQFALLYSNHSDLIISLKENVISFTNYNFTYHQEDLNNLSFIEQPNLTYHFDKHCLSIEQINEENYET